MLSGFWSFFAVLGFWGWTSCALLLALRGFPSSGSHDVVEMKKWGIPLLLLYTIWLVGLVKG